MTSDADCFISDDGLTNASSHSVDGSSLGALSLGVSVHADCLSLSVASRDASVLLVSPLESVALLSAVSVRFLGDEGLVGLSDEPLSVDVDVSFEEPDGISDLDVESVLSMMTTVVDASHVSVISMVIGSDISLVSMVSSVFSLSVSGIEDTSLSVISLTGLVVLTVVESS